MGNGNDKRIKRDFDVILRTGPEHGPIMIIEKELHCNIENIMSRWQEIFLRRWVKWIGYSIEEGGGYPKLEVGWKY